MKDYDVIVIGAGHNGLTCSAYLARAGLKVKVVERRSIVGGAAITEEFHPGFRNSVYSYAVSLLHPTVIAELELAQHGLEILERPAGTISLLENDHLLLPRNDDRIREQIARFSSKDAEAFPTLDAGIGRVASVLRTLATIAPPNMGGNWQDVMRSLTLGNQLRRLKGDDQALLVELFTRSLGDFLDSWFEAEPLKGVLGLECIIGNYIEPYETGSAYVLLHHAFGEVNGRKGAWGIARGGMGSITGAMASFARSKGADIETDAGVSEVVLNDKRAEGVVLEDGRKITARMVVANVHPQTLLLKMIDTDQLLTSEQKRRISSYRSHSATFRMNVALSELPRFHTLENADAQALSGAIEISPSLAYIKQAYRDAEQLGWAREPVVSMWIPSTTDDTLAPEGCHVASLFCQHFHRHLPEEKTGTMKKMQRQNPY